MNKRWVIERDGAYFGALGWCGSVRLAMTYQTKEQATMGARDWRSINANLMAGAVKVVEIEWHEPVLDPSGMNADYDPFGLAR
jgi:hypothetical protein